MRDVDNTYHQVEWRVEVAERERRSRLHRRLLFVILATVPFYLLGIGQMRAPVEATSRDGPWLSAGGASKTMPTPTLAADAGSIQPGAAPAQAPVPAAPQQAPDLSLSPSLPRWQDEPLNGPTTWGQDSSSARVTVGRGRPESGGKHKFKEHGRKGR